MPDNMTFQRSREMSCTAAVVDANDTTAVKHPSGSCRIGRERLNKPISVRMNERSAWTPRAVKGWQSRVQLTNNAVTRKLETNFQLQTECGVKRSISGEIRAGFVVAAIRSPLGLIECLAIFSASERVQHKGVRNSANHTTRPVRRSI